MKSSKAEKQAELEKRLRELEREHKDTDQVMSEMGVRRKKVEIEIKQIRNQLSQLKPKVVGVTDHALLRYIERRHGIDVAKYKKEILDQIGTSADLGTITAFGFVIKDNNVVTYTPQQGDASEQNGKGQ